MAIDSDQEKPYHGLPVFQLALGVLIGIGLGGGSKFVSARLMTDQSRIPLDPIGINYALDREELNWLGNGLVLIGLAFFATAFLSKKST